jgi:hypothetical protein
VLCSGYQWSKLTGSLLSLPIGHTGSMVGAIFAVAATITVPSVAS